MAEVTWVQALAVVAAVAGIVSATAGSLNYLAGRRERQQRSRQSQPQLRAVINRTFYKDGWRSVQLHIRPADATAQFTNENWCIEEAVLLRPKSGILARAAEDDYATGVFFPEGPVKRLAGRREGKAQRFALEFFIKGVELGERAAFNVTFARPDGGQRRTVRAEAVLPADAAVTPP